MELGNVLNSSLLIVSLIGRHLRGNCSLLADVITISCSSMFSENKKSYIFVNQLLHFSSTVALNNGKNVFDTINSCSSSANIQCR